MTIPLYPALFIGLGGTGVKTLRFIQSLADEDLVPGLAETLTEKKIRLLAIDTDPKSNKNEQVIDKNLLSISKNGDDTLKECLPSKLSIIQEEWLPLKRDFLNEAIQKLKNQRQTIDIQHNDLDSRLNYLHAAKWFPKPNPENGDYLGLGHSDTAGAAQYRPLGRLTIFHNSPEVFDLISRNLKDLEQHTLETKFINVFIVCSLAGGTGSGMFWDTAFLTKLCGVQSRISGFFLLGDAFEAVDQSGRIFPNVYAALKELTYLKNWQHSFDTTYPIADKVFPPKGKEVIPFHNTFIFNSFIPGIGVSDPNKARIDVTCYRIAKNMLSNLRHDLFSFKDIGENNERSDLNILKSSKQRGFVFSTSASLWFLTAKTEVIKEAKEELFKRHWLNPNDLHLIINKTRTPLYQDEVDNKKSHSTKSTTFSIDDINQMPIDSVTTNFKPLLLNLKGELEKILDNHAKETNIIANSFDSVIDQLNSFSFLNNKENKDTKINISGFIWDDLLKVSQGDTIQLIDLSELAKTAVNKSLESLFNNIQVKVSDYLNQENTRIDQLKLNSLKYCSSNTVAMPPSAILQLERDSESGLRDIDNTFIEKATNINFDKVSITPPNSWFSIRPYILNENEIELMESIKNNFRDISKKSVRTDLEYSWYIFKEDFQKDLLKAKSRIRTTDTAVLLREYIADSWHKVYKKKFIDLINSLKEFRSGIESTEHHIKSTYEKPYNNLKNRFQNKSTHSSLLHFPNNNQSPILLHSNYLTFLRHIHINFDNDTNQQSRLAHCTKTLIGHFESNFNDSDKYNIEHLTLQRGKWWASSAL